MEASAAQNASGAAPATGRSRALITQTRELVRDRLNKTIAEAFEKLEGDLVKLAEAAGTRDEQQVMFEAITQLKAHRGELSVAFDRCFLKVFDQRIEGPGAAAAERKPVRFEELSLVDDHEIEEEIVISQLAKKAKDAIDEDQLIGIRARIGYLLAKQELADEANPIAPEAIIAALKQACDQIPAQAQVKTALLNAFQPYVAAGIKTIYSDVNQRLIAEQVLPRIDFTVMRQRDSGRAGGSGQPAPTAGPANRMPTAVTDAREFLAGLARHAGGTAGPVDGGLTDADISGLLARVLAGPPEARSQVARMLAEPSRYAFEEAIRIPASPALLDSLSSLQAKGDRAVGEGTLVQDLHAHIHPLDQLTIELVTVVFDYLLNDRALSPPVKAELSRLQIVAVKAAVLDRTFFARRQHPMRQLLDRIAAAGGDPEIDTSAEGAFIAGLHSIVTDIVGSFDDDLAVFDTALERVEALVDQALKAREKEFEKTTAKLVQQEQAEIAHASALAEMRRRIRRSTPDFAREFLLDWWTQVLVDAYLHDRQGEDSWTHRLGVADALVWSVGTLRRGEITQLASMLPTLMRSLLRGMNAVAIPAEIRHSFFNQLMETHTAMVNAAKARAELGTSGPLSISDLSAVPQAEEPAPPAANDPAVQEDYYTHTVRALQRGAILQFVEGEESVRSKLSWVSPRQTIYLFTSQAGARSLTPEMLAKALRSGRARIVDASDALVDRIVEAAVGAAA